VASAGAAVGAAAAGGADPTAAGSAAPVALNCAEVGYSPAARLGMTLLVGDENNASIG